jgi:hypothetical protein
MLNVRCEYNLSDIPGFNDLLKGDDRDDALSSILNSVKNTPFQGHENILKLNKIECRTSNNAVYKVIRYDKDVLNCDLVSTYGLCRSVIVNNNNSVVGFAPPKSIPCESFIKKYDVTGETGSDVIAEEFVEGTMITVFWDKTLCASGGWEISTRNIVGATSRFFKAPTGKGKPFRTMFLDAMSENNVSFDHLNQNYCYSFVLQHPDNRIVIPCKTSKLYLVAVYFIDDSITDRVTIYPQDIDELKNSEWLQNNIHFPERYLFTNYSELVDRYGSMNTPYDVMGVVLYNKKTGERAKIRNPVYEQVRNLRGNQPKLQYQYLSLRREGKVRDYLKFYSENKKNFSEYRDQIHLFTNTLFENYVSCYIKKEKPLIEFTDQYRTHMFNIHQTYMNYLREAKITEAKISVDK